MVDMRYLILYHDQTSFPLGNFKRAETGRHPASLVLL